MNVKRLEDIESKREELAALLVNGVESGASIGFLPPLSLSDARQYWDGLAADLRSGLRLLLIASIDDHIAGAVQLALCTKKNGLHRAEIEKLIVHTGYRRAGLGRALMNGIEQLAREYARTLLVLDTRSGDTASILYRKCGYIEAGQIPDYALNDAGNLDATTYFYKRL